MFVIVLHKEISEFTIFEWNTNLSCKNYALHFVFVVLSFSARCGHSIHLQLTFIRLLLLWTHYSVKFRIVRSDISSTLSVRLTVYDISKIDKNMIILKTNAFCVLLLWNFFSIMCWYSPKCILSFTKSNFNPPKVG